MFCGLNGEDIPYQEQTKKIENYIYQLNQPIGKGNFSQVFRGVDENNGRSVAIKVIKYSSLSSRVAEQLLKNQIQLLKQLSHDNILKCHEVLSSKNNCYIITDFYEGGDLEKLLQKHKRFKEKQILKIVHDVFQGLFYLNDLSIVHRDLKVANIFITTNGTCKIADFGFAIRAKEPFKDIKIGSPIYMSPEGLLLNEYGPKTDVWSFGILVYELLHGDTPLAGCRTQAQLKQRVLLPPKFSQRISDQVRHFINLCLTVDPKHRPDMKSLAQTTYIRRTFAQLQKQKISKQISSTMYASTMNTNLLVPMIKSISTYEQGLALLQYCRLIHKTCQFEPSPILSQWLLNISSKLQWMPLDREVQKNDKLIGIAKEYYLKYQKSHGDNRVELYFDDAIRQAKRLMKDSQAQGYLRLLMKETQMLQRDSSMRQLSHYASSTQIQQFLQKKKITANYYR